MTTPTEDARVAKARGYAQTASWLTGADIVTDLLDAYDERLRVNVGLVAENAELRKRLREHEVIDPLAERKAALMAQIEAFLTGGSTPSAASASAHSAPSAKSGETS